MASLMSIGHRFARLCRAYAIDMQSRSVQLPSSSRPEMVSSLPEAPPPSPRACKCSLRRPDPAGTFRELARNARPAAAAAPRCIPHSPIEPSPIEGGHVEELRDFPRAHTRLCGRMLPRRGGVPSDQSGGLDLRRQHARCGEHSRCARRWHDADGRAR